MKELFTKFKRKINSVLAFTLVIALCAGFIPDSLLGAVNVYAGVGNGGDAYLCLINDESSDDNTTYTIWKKAGATWVPNAQAIAGTSYDESTNTLTLNNFDGSKQYLETNAMGEDFKIKLVGSNTLRKIYVYGAGYGGSLDITGSGSLDLNATKTLHSSDRSAICLRGECSKSRLTIENTASVHAISDTGQPAIMITDSLDHEGIVVKGVLNHGEVLSGNTKIAKAITVDTTDAGIYVCSAYQDLYKDNSENYYGVVLSTISSGMGENKVEIPYYTIYTLDGGEDGCKVTGTASNDNWEAEFDWAKAYCSPGNLWFKNIPDYLTPVPDPLGLKNYTIGVAESDHSNIFTSALSDVMFIATQSGDKDNNAGMGYCVFPENTYELVNKDSFFSLYYYPKSLETVSKVTANISYKTGDTLQTKTVTLAKADTGYKFQGKLSEILGSVSHIDAVDIYENGDKVFSKKIEKDISTQLNIKFTGDGCNDDDHTKTLIIKSDHKEIYKKSLGKSKLTEISLNTLPVDSSLTAELMIAINGSQTLLGKTANIVTKSGEKTASTIDLASLPLTFSPKVTVTKRNRSGKSRSYNATLRPTEYEITWYKDEESDEVLGTGASFTNKAGDTSEYLYAGVVLKNEEALSFESDTRFKVKYGDETAIDIPAITKSNNITVILKDENGNRIDGVPIVIEKEKCGYTSCDTLYSGSQGSYLYPSDAKVNVKLSYPAYEFATHQDTSLLCSDNEEKELVIVPRKGVITSNYYVRNATVKTVDGKNVPFEIRDQMILLDKNSVSPGQELKLHLESGNYGIYQNPFMYFDKQITLDDNAGTIITDSWDYYGKVSAVVKGNHGKTEGTYFGLLYDSTGRLIGDLHTLSYYNGETTVFLIGCLREDHYTLLIADKNAVNAIGQLSVQTLKDAKTGLDSWGTDLYTESKFDVKDDDDISMECQFPSGDYHDGTINLSDSQISISATPEKISYHAVISLNGSSSKEASVSVITNQKYQTDYTALPKFIGDYFIVNGKKIRADVGQNGSYKGVHFEGKGAGYGYNYTCYTFMFDDVDQYGGFPLDIQWSVKRSQRGTLFAEGYLSKDKSGADVMAGDGKVHFFGRDECISPAVTCYVPDQISDSEFHVYGYAPLNAKVTLSLDGKDVETVQAAGINGYFCATLTLDDPVGRQRHFVVAKADYDGKTFYSNRMCTTYCASNQTLYKIELTDMNESYHTVWEDGIGAEGGYYYYSETVPMKYRLSFENITGEDDLSEVTIHVPRGDDILLLPCEFKEVKDGIGIWESDDYLFGAAPPRGAWVSFKSGLSVVQITPDDKNNYMKISAENANVNQALVDAVGKDESDEKRNSEAGKMFTDVLADAGIYDVKLFDSGELKEASVSCNSTEYFGSDFNYNVIVKSSKKTGCATEKKSQLDSLSYPADIAETFENSDVTQIFDPNTKTLYLEPDDLMPYIAYHAGDGTNESPFVVECIMRHTGTDGSYLYNHITMSLCDYTQEMIDGINDEVTTLSYQYKEGKESDLPDLSSSTRMYEYEGEKSDSNASYMSANLAYKQNEVRAFWGMFLSNMYDAALGMSANTENVSTGSVSDNNGPIHNNALKYDFEKLAVSKGFSPKDDPNPCAALTKEQSKIFSSPEASYAALLMMVYNDNKGPAGSNDAALYMESNNLGINKLALICGFLTSEDFCREMNDLLSKASLGAGLVNNGLTATGLTKTFKEKIISDFQGDALGKFLAEIGVSNHKALDKATKVIYESLLEAEKDGVKVNWDNFPFSDKYPDPRKKQEKDDTSSDEGGENGGSGENGGTGENGENDGSGGTGKTGEPIPDSPTASKDPSGYVYEAVASNRIKNVTAILYEIDPEDGKKYKWNDSETGQTNPYITNDYGIYEWGVDDGAYQVTFEKDGYDFYSTADHPEDGINTKQIGTDGEYYLPVPPQQVDVNIGLTSTGAPEVVRSDIKSIAGDGIDLSFSQYMDTSSLIASNLSVTDVISGKAYAISDKNIRYPDAEPDPKNEDKLYTKAVHIGLPELKGNSEVLINVSCNVKNYAGVPLAQSFSIIGKIAGGSSSSDTEKPSGDTNSSAKTNPPEKDPATDVTTPSNAEDYKVNAPVITSLKKAYKSFTATWKAESGNTEYELQYATKKNFKDAKSRICKPKKSSFSVTVKKLKGNKKYFVRLRTIKTVAGKKYYSDWSAVKTVKTTNVKVNKPKLKTLKAGNTSFSAVWKRAKGITNYELQYSVNKNFKGKKSKSITANSNTVNTTIKNLKKNKKYYVRIRAIKIVKRKKYYSDWSKVKSFKTK